MSSLNDMVSVFVSLGSNLGNRDGNLRSALELLSENPFITVEKVSAFCASEPQGRWSGEGGLFLNACAKLLTGLSPEKLLSVLKDIEQSMGRTGVPEYDDEGNRIYSDRIIDIDILLYGSLKLSTDTLQIPHPRMLERDFVMKPLMEIYDGSSEMLECYAS